MTVFCLCVSVSLLVPQSLSLLDSVPLSVSPTHTHTTCTQQESQEQRPEAGKCRPGSPFWESRKRRGRRKRGTERRPQATWHRRSGVGGSDPGPRCRPRLESREPPGGRVSPNEGICVHSNSEILRRAVGRQKNPYKAERTDESLEKSQGSEQFESSDGGERRSERAIRGAQRARRRR